MAEAPSSAGIDTLEEQFNAADCAIVRLLDQAFNGSPWSPESVRDVGDERATYPVAPNFAPGHWRVRPIPGLKSPWETQGSSRFSNSIPPGPWRTGFGDQRIESLGGRIDCGRKIRWSGAERDSLQKQLPRAIDPDTC
jgi:hypothetical protein